MNLKPGLKLCDSEVQTKDFFDSNLKPHIPETQDV